MNPIANLTSSIRSASIGAPSTQMAPTDPAEPIMPNIYIVRAPPHADPLLIRHYMKPYVRQRRAKLSLLSSAFGEHESFKLRPVEDRFLLIEKIEKAVFRFTLHQARNSNVPLLWSNTNFCDIYDCAIARIAANISKESSINNDYLYEALTRGDIDPNELSHMSSQQLFPGKFREIEERLAVSRATTFSKKTTSMYWCRKCHRNQCTEENLYNRSLDEGVNLTITCVNCGNVWKA